MLPVDIAVLALLVAGLVFSIIELGLTAYEVNFLRQPFEVDGIDFNGDIDVETYRVSVPGELSFLLFCSIWSTIISAALIARGVLKHHPMNEKMLGIWTFVLNALTMVFWLAGFAAFVALIGVGYTYPGIPGATVAFSILAWLVFLALLILNFLTAFGTLRSDRPGYGAVFTNRTPGTGPSYHAPGSHAPSSTAPTYQTQPESHQPHGYPQQSYPQQSYPQQSYPQQEYSQGPPQSFNPTSAPNHPPNMQMDTSYQSPPAPGVSHNYNAEHKYEG